MYEWDPKKSDSNKTKHGISFEEARDFIFEGPNLLATDVAHVANETRHAVIGKHKWHYFTGIFTIRHYRIRIISVRRARSEEKDQAKKAGI